MISFYPSYGIRGVTFDCLKSYHNDRNQYRTINNKRSEIQTIKYGVPQGSIPEPLLFLIYINDLSLSLEKSNIHHFADDTDVLHASNYLRDIDTKTNFDLSNVVQWPQANKVALNVTTTDTVIFRSPRYQITRKINFCLSG